MIENTINWGNLRPQTSANNLSDSNWIHFKDILSLFLAYRLDVTPYPFILLVFIIFFLNILFRISMAIRLSKNPLNIHPIYSPRTTYKKIKEQDEKMIADMTLNFDKLTINMLKE